MLLLHRHVYAVYVYEDPVYKVKSLIYQFINSYFQWVCLVTCRDLSGVATLSCNRGPVSASFHPYLLL